MKLVIDRFEGEYAVCEKGDRTMINIHRSKLPANTKEGDVIELAGDTIKIDMVETERRSKEIKKLMDKLRK